MTLFHGSSMTDKQRFMIYVKLGNLMAYIREKNNCGICDAVNIMLSKGIIQKIEDLETGYYLESSGYLIENFQKDL